MPQAAHGSTFTNGKSAASHPGVGQGERYAGFESRGWRPSCQCGAATVAALVLDPFVGTGTTVVEANRLGRRAVGVELSGRFCQNSIKTDRARCIIRREFRKFREFDGEIAQCCYQELARRGVRARQC
jgi:tRNA G10  N-methylase Trm11